MRDRREAPRAQPSVVAPDRSSGAVSFTVTDDVDAYTGSLPGVEIEAFRNGTGSGPNTALSYVDGEFCLISGNVGFPLLSRTTVGDRSVVVAFMRSTPPGSRWCEIDIVPGTILSYGSGAEHTAVSPPGLNWVAAITEEERLAELAERLELQFEPVARGEVHELNGSVDTGAIGGALGTLANAAARGERSLIKTADDVFRAMILAFTAGPDDSRRIGSDRGLDSRHIINSCVDYADSTERIPSISELCLVAHVSERRLRKAFTDEYDLPPGRFFRIWALTEAHRRLADADPTYRSVADIATGLGFFHLGRFAGYYKRLYGTTPSATLRSHDVATA
jgi:AraC-like DNA-binding protein